MSAYTPPNPGEINTPGKRLKYFLTHMFEGRQKDFAALIKKRPGSVSNYIKDEYQIPPSVAELIESKLGLPAEWLLYGEGEPHINRRDSASEPFASYGRPEPPESFFPLLDDCINGSVRYQAKRKSGQEADADDELRRIFLNLHALRDIARGYFQIA